MQDAVPLAHPPLWFLRVRSFVALRMKCSQVFPQFLYNSIPSLHTQQRSLRGLEFSGIHEHQVVYKPALEDFSLKIYF